MLDEPPFIGDWHRVKKLGSGGFGVVWLWKHAKSNEKIAVKKCHISMGPNAAKQKERWEREVDLMTNKIRHENIVRGIKVKPETFLTDLDKTNPSGMPILLMEYCEGGDLRHQLNNSKNCSGFPESEVRKILQALKSAVSHLHSLSITHRDIKPENVVINIYPNGKKVYKLTDLGYAKPLDLRSIEASIVGTMEYIAPELLTTERYSSSVDYWSLGIIGYEVVTGFRPFLPHLGMAQYLLRIKDKRSEHITISENDQGNFQYLSTIYPENYLSKEFASRLENWFKLALEWNPKQRGCVFERASPLRDKSKAVSFADEKSSTVDMVSSIPPVQVLKFFNTLDDALSRKILTIFVLPSHKYLSLEINADTTIDELYTFIETETKIPKSKCHFILPLENLNAEVGKSCEQFRPQDFYIDDRFDKPMLFVSMLGNADELMKSSTNGKDDAAIPVELPASVRNVLTNHECKLKPHTLKKFACDALYFIKRENQKYINCLEGLFNYALQLNHEIELRKNDLIKVSRLIYGLNGALELYSQSLNDAKIKMTEFYPQLVSEVHPVWLDQHTKLSLNIQLLVDACEKIVVRYQSIHRRSRDTHQSDLLVKQRTQDQYDIINATKAFEAVRAQIMNKSFVEKPHFELFQCVYKCLKRRDQLLRHKDLIDLQRNLSNIHVELNEIKKALEKSVVPAEKYKRELFLANTNLQNTIWSLSNKSKMEATGSSAGNLTHALNGVTLSPAITAESNKLQESLPNLAESLYRSQTSKTGAPPTNFKLGAFPVQNDKDQFGNSVLCFGESHNTKILIDDNEKLRVSIEGLMREIDEEFGAAEALFTKKPDTNSLTSS